MRPESGFMSPRASFRIVLLPEPATPKMALVSPRYSWNEMPSSTCLSSNAMDTSSNWIVMADCGPAVLTGCSETAGGLTICAGGSLAEYCHRKPGHKKVHSDDQDRRGHDRLGGGATDSLGAAARRDPVVTADGCDDKAEQDRLGQAHEDVLENQDLPGGAPVLVRVHAEEETGRHPAAGQAEEVGDDRQKKQHHYRRDDAGGDQLPHGISP